MTQVMHSLKKYSKKCLQFCGIAVVTIVLWASALTPVAKADCIWDLTTGEFTCGETEGEQVSFTDFQGGLDAPDESEYDDGLTQATSAREFILNVVNFALAFLGLIAVVVIIYAGFLYVTAHGEEGQTGKAKKAIIGAIIGIVLILGSFALVNTIIREAARGGQDIGDGSTTADTDLTQFESDTINTFDVEAIQTELQSITSAVYNDNLSYVAIEAKIDEVETAVNTFDDYATQEANLEENYNEAVADLADTYTSTIDPTGVLKAAAEENLAEEYENDLEDLEDSVKDELEALNLILEELVTQVSQFSETYERVTYFSNDLDDLFAYEENDHTQWAMIPTAHALEINVLGSVAGILTLDAYDCAIGDLTFETITSDDLETCVEGLNDGNVYDFGEGIEVDIETLESIEALFEPENTIYDTVSNAGSYARSLQSEPTNDNLRLFVNVMGTIYNAVGKMSITRPKIAVDANQGNAPLVVNFDGLGSSDAGISEETNQSLQDAQYEWDLNGNGTWGETTATCNETTGAAATCTFMEPGTYRAGLRVVSADTANIISGVTYFNIEVSPSTATIKLTATTTSNGTVTLIDETATIPVHRTSYKFILSEAQAGITFDLTDSKGSNDNELTLVQWDFGDGTREETAELYLSHVYQEEGKYHFMVTVTDTSGMVNREIVEIYVSSPAARVEVSSNTTNQQIPVSFDSGSSSTDNGSLAERTWEITNQDGTAETLNDPNAISFDQLFSAPGYYNVELTVVDSTGSEDTAIEAILVESQIPVPCFTANAPRTTQPATYTLDASCSVDPDEGDTLTYTWTITGTEGVDWEFVDGTNQSEVPTVQFLKIGSYTVTLSVSDQYTDPLLQQSAVTARTINVDSILDIDVDADVISAVLEEGQTEVTFTLQSAIATGFDVNFDDGESTSVAATSGGETTVTHRYTQAGHFEVQVIAYTDEGDENMITQNIFIGNGDTPIAAPVILINSVEVAPDESTGAYNGNRSDTFTFDASDSLNGDGSKRGLTYSWAFGDGGISTQKTTTHTYQDTGDFTAKLVVTNREGLTDEAEVTITIVGEPPSFESMYATPRSQELVTPLGMTVAVIGADDPDGTIAQYTWWYYDASNSSEKLGQTTTSGNTAILTINTNGTEGEEHTYGFGVSLKDDEGNTVSSDTVLATEAIPTITVTNGANDTPTVSLNADHTSIYVNDTIAFSADATDPDGTIDQYEWDFGTGTFSSTNGSGVTYSATVNQTFTAKDTDGLKIRVRVTDNAGATAQDELMIYIDSDANPPEAAFTWSAEKKVVTFTNNSSADSASSATLASYAWDFNTNADANGNGTRNDDVDATDANPTYTYDAYGVYSVQLTVTDSNGETDKVTQSLTLTAPEVTLDAKLTSSLDTAENGSTIVITGSSGTVTFDTSTSEGEITKYWIDGNVYYDSDKNGKTDDDHDYEATSGGTWSATYQSAYGQVMAKLTIEDEEGNSDYVTRQVQFEESTGTTDILKPANDGMVMIVAVLLLSGIVLLMQEGVIPVSWRGGKRGRKNHSHKK